MKTLKDLDKDVLWYHSQQKEILFMGNPTPEKIERYNDKEFVLVEDVRLAAINHAKYLMQRLDPKKEYDYWKKTVIRGRASEVPMTDEEVDKMFFKSDMEMVHRSINRHEAMLGWIKYFFDITDEELK